MIDRPAPPATRFPVRQLGFLIALLAATASGVARADAIQTADGRILVGDLLEVTDEGVRIEVEGGAVFVPADRMEPGSFHQVRTRTLAPTDAAGRYRLGRYCQRHGLWIAARQEYERAAAIDPARAEVVGLRLAEVESAHGQSLFEEGLAAHRAGDVETACRRLVRFFELYPDHRLSGAARSTLAAAQAALDRKRRAASPEARARAGRVEDARAREEAVSTRAARAEQELGAARQALDEGLAASEDRLVSAAEKAFAKGDGACRVGLRALSEARRLCRDADRIAELEAKAAETMAVLSGLHHAWARLSAGQGNWKSAARHNQMALEADATNEDARNFQSTIDQNYVHRSMKKLLNLQDQVR